MAVLLADVDVETLVVAVDFEMVEPLSVALPFPERVTTTPVAAVDPVVVVTGARDPETDVDTEDTAVVTETVLESTGVTIPLISL